MRQAKGFTLIEILVAIALLAIIGSAIIAFMPTIVTLNRRSTQEQTTTVDTKRFFERVRQDWSNSATFTAGTLPAAPAGCTSAVQDPDAGSPGIRKRVTLTCTDVSSPFIAEFGKP